MTVNFEAFLSVLFLKWHCYHNQNCVLLLIYYLEEITNTFLCHLEKLTLVPFNSKKWDNEEERTKIVQEKHERGYVARLSRERRIQEKELRKSQRENRYF
jgi:hypothetical protein